MIALSEMAKGSGCKYKHIQTSDFMQLAINGKPNKNQLSKRSLVVSQSITEDRSIPLKMVLDLCSVITFSMHWSLY
jgi:hypothetical protein